MSLNSIVYFINLYLLYSVIVMSTSTVSSFASVTVIVAVDAVELSLTETVTTSTFTVASTEVLSLSTV